MIALLIVVDSCIWISALRFGGVPLEALRIAFIYHRIVICDEIEREVYKVLVEKFRLTHAQVHEALSPFLLHAMRVHITGDLKACRDPKDDMILECAAVADADVILSSDHDLTDMQTFAKARILKARQFLDQQTDL